MAKACLFLAFLSVIGGVRSEWHEDDLDLEVDADRVGRILLEAPSQHGEGGPALSFLSLGDWGCGPINCMVSAEDMPSLAGRTADGTAALCSPSSPPLILPMRHPCPLSSSTPDSMWMWAAVLEQAAKAAEAADSKFVVALGDNFYWRGNIPTSLMNTQLPNFG